MARQVAIPSDSIRLEGELSIPDRATGVVLFAHGSGSSRRSIRNRFVAEVLQRHHVATLLMDLLTREEDADPGRRFDIPLLSSRLAAALRFADQDPGIGALPRRPVSSQALVSSPQSRIPAR